jgi:predicted  nucleic acid-binding Zn-ribbon protein
MDPKEIDALIARIDRLKSRQAEIEAMQQKMAQQAGTVRKAIAAQETTLRELKTVTDKKQPLTREVGTEDSARSRAFRPELPR